MQPEPAVTPASSNAALQKPHADRIVPGMAAAAASVFMLSTMNMFAKLVSSEHSVIEVAFYRNVFAVAPFLVVIFLFGRRDLLKINSQPRALAARAVIGTVSLLTTFSAFIYLPMADAQALFFTSSLFIPVLGYFFLNERVGPYRWGAVAVGFAGTVLMVQPGGTLNVTGVALAVSAAFMHAILGTLLRLIGRTERPETVAFYFLLTGTLLTGIGFPFVAKTPGHTDMLYFIGAGVSGAFAQVLLSIAFKYAPAALATIFNYTGIVWAAAYGWLIWGDWPQPVVWMGASVIIASSVFIVLRERGIARHHEAASREETG